MRSVVLSLLVVQILLGGAFSGVEERKGKPMCVNPRAKVGASILSGCSQANCKKEGKGKAVWQVCEQVALEKTVENLRGKIDKNHEDLERKIEDRFEDLAKKIEENHRKISEILGEFHCGPTMQTSTIAPSSTTSEGCPSGWSLYESSCYRFYASEISWVQAQAECQKENSNLASVTDAGINTFIGSLRGGELAWIGGSRPACSDPSVGWEWLDNSAWNYQNWMDGEPNGRCELCIVQFGYSYEWNDGPCSFTQYSGHICQKNLSSA